MTARHFWTTADQQSVSGGLHSSVCDALQLAPVRGERQYPCSTCCPCCTHRGIENMGPSFQKKELQHHNKPIHGTISPKW
mmetsp:Transcript_84675/g.141138  ORF Transcript_84675/g.141138 Transcript_84675/m.141138 type:complete len:80 (-) Transcript_84675:747-986(-)